MDDRRHVMCEVSQPSSKWRLTPSYPSPARVVDGCSASFTAMNRTALGLLAALLFSGCATSTIETRKHERYAAYAELPAEQKAAADTGQLKVGMPMDAVYIAW